jgi:hypothetical protein
MRCGHCGKAIKEGFRTCSTCGATLERVPGLFINFLFYVAGGFVVSAVLFWGADERDKAIGLFLMGLTAFAANRALLWRVPYKWYR